MRAVVATMTTSSMPGTAFGSDKVLTALLTTESLLFAVMALTFTFGSAAINEVVMQDTAKRIAVVAALVLTALGAGAAVAWVDLFVRGDWPDHFTAWFPVAALALGAVAQPLFAWGFVINIYRR
jgi:hypothetical protein